MIYAIGDIHGKFDLLKKLYEEIVADIEKHGDEKNKIIFLGDYIDRGNQNVLVLNFLMHLEDKPNLEHVFLKGNHEDIFKEAMLNPNNRWTAGMWVSNGGKAFLAEVGMDLDYFVHTFPWEHYVKWFDSHLDYYHETEDYVFVHGGLDIRETRMNRQENEHLMWARHNDRGWYRSFPKLVVHGHTPGPDPVVDLNRINVDTSWSYSKYPGVLMLTAVALPNRRVKTYHPPETLGHLQAVSAEEEAMGRFEDEFRFIQVQAKYD